MIDNSDSLPPAWDPERFRPTGATEWELPPWGDPIARGVFPLLTKVERHLIPTGTAFAISSTGILMTALHNALEALKSHPRGDKILQRNELPPHIDLGSVGLYALHSHWRDSSRLDLNLWSIEGGHGAPPSDLLLTPTRFQSHFPFSHLRLSFSLPKVGSRVFCLGYSDAQIPKGALSVDDFERGRISDWFTHYKHKLNAVEGKVKYVFTQRFTRGYMPGPCYVVEAEVKSGMSGGPVFNDDGSVCGVVSATASTFFDHPATLISPLYPAMMTEVKFGIQLGSLRINGIQPLHVMIGLGAVLTDGTEELVTLQPEGSEWRVGLIANDDQAAFVFEDFYGFENGTPAEPDEGNPYRIRRRRKGDSGPRK